MAIHVVVANVEPAPNFASTETGQTRSALFFELDARVRNIEQRFKTTWMELSELCIQIQEEELWREGEYDSYGQWLVNACPACRSYAYASVKARKELADIPREDLLQIPLRNAVTLQKTPRNRRKRHLIEQAKQQSPEQFLQTVEEEIPEAHVETNFVHHFRLTRSASKVLRSGLDMWRMLNNDPTAPVEAALEGLIADYMTSHQGLLEAKLREMNS